MSIRTFNDKETLKQIREQSLNLAITAVNDLDPKVKGLQAVVALTLTEPVVDVNDKKITFNLGDTGLTKEIELGPMFDSYQHGIGVSGATGGTIPGVEKIKFKNLSVVDTGNKGVEITAPEIMGQVGATSARYVNRLNITGNINGSSLDSSGTMTINMPNNSIGASVNGASSDRVDKIHITDDSKGSSVLGDTLEIKIPDPIKGALEGSGEQPIKSMRFVGNIGTSTETGGEFVIDLPKMQGEVETDPGPSHITDIKIIGNVGGSKIESTTLTIDLPVGGGGGGPSELKVGEKNFSPISNVGEIWFEGSSVKVDTSRSTTKVLVTPKGTPVEIENSGEPIKNAKQIKLTGDVETSSISDTGLLTINIPHHEGLSVSDGSTVSKGITTLTFKESDVVIDSSASAKATITPKGVTGILDGKTEAVKEIEITGTLGGSTLANGKLKIDLPAGGGGGTGGADITGVVGSQSAKIDRIEIIGSNTYNSSVTGSTLKVDLPRKVAIRGGADQYSDVDIVEVANSTVTLDSAGGNRKALITPHIPYMFFGWFPDMETLNRTIPVSGRIPTKTCAYVPDPQSRQNTLWMWMPDVGTGINEWKAMPTTGSLALVNNNHSIQGILGINKNPMVNVDSNGLMTISDTTVPEVICKTLSQDGTSTIKDGKFNEIRFEDGEGVVDFDLNALDLKVHRAQRRFGMGDSDAIEASSYTEDKYEGSIWLNKTDGAWWGYNNKDVATGQKKWTKVIHRGMSDDVTNILKRVPQVIPSLTVTTPNGDDKAWAESGWTHLPINSVALPEETRNKTGGYIETFVVWDPDVIGKHHRYQMVHVETDAATYKRYWKFTEMKWSDWVKTSFNPLELKAHNEDPQAHRMHNPFFRAFSFGAKYPDFAGDIKSTLKYIVEKQECRLIGTSGGHYNMDPGGDYIKVPYKGLFTVRGLAYIGGKSDLGTTSIAGDWIVELQKCEAGSAVYEPVASKKYEHKTGTLKYPPFSFKFERVSLERGDFLRLKIEFKPTTGTEKQFFDAFPDLWIMPGRSYFAVDEDGNDTGYAIAKGMCDMFGGFSPTGAGAFSYPSGKWPQDKGNIVGDGLETAVIAG